MAINFPSIDPVVIHIWGPLSITWYSLAYVAGILLGYYYFKKLNNKFSLKISEKYQDDIITFAIIGIIIGGRLGYILFYDFNRYMANPFEILQTWKGGMSFHGGIIGLIMSIYITAKFNKQNFLIITDIISCVAPIGLFFGRIANFINGELYGNVTNQPWGIIFLHAGSMPRHPSQLYEAFLEGIIIFAIQRLLINRTNIIKYNGLLSAIFLTQYAFFRYLIEFFREPDSHIGYISNFTMGQILSLPMILVALILVIRNRKQLLK